MLDAAQTPAIAVRSATRDDIALLARLDHEASLPPFERPFWDDLLEGTGTAPLDFLEAMFAVGGSNWGAIEDFLILEVDGAPAAGCAVYLATGDAARGHPLNLARLPAIAEWLAWPRATRDAFEAAYRALWAEDPIFYAPQAPAIVETVAVLPEHRGRGLGDRLMVEAKARARGLGVDAVGIMVVHGNDAAARLYAKHFEPWATFHPAYFGGAVPGLTKFRAALD